MLRLRHPLLIYTYIDDVDDMFDLATVGLIGFILSLISFMICIYQKLVPCS
jgi:hypothetical protein